MLTKVLILTCLVGTALSVPANLIGGPSHFSKEDAETLLSSTLLLISNGEKNTNMKVRTILSASSQVVSGIAYTIEADLTINDENKDNCTARILEQPWLDTNEGGKGGQTEITCPDGHKKKFFHTVAEKLTPKGAPKESSIEDATKAINAYLPTLDGGPHPTLHRVISATTQLVAGTLRKIRADFKYADGKIETCNVELWEQPWLDTNEAVKFDFDCPEYGKKSVQHKIVKYL